MNIKIYNRKGIRLETEGKYCEENIDIEVDESLFNGTVIIIPSVKNLYCDKHYTLTWTTPDFSSLSEYNATFSYIVKVNDKELTTTSTSYVITPYLNEGENEVSVTVKAVLTTYDDGIKKEIKYSLPNAQIVKLDVTFSHSGTTANATSLGTNIYLSNTSKTYKFDTITENMVEIKNIPAGGSYITLVAVGDYLYSLNGYSYSNPDYKMNLLTEEVTKLSTYCNFTSALSDGTDIYGKVSYNTGGIKKFDTITETLTTVVDSVASSVNLSSIVKIKDKLYVFGGRVGSSGIGDTTKNMWEIDISEGTYKQLTNLSYSLYTKCYGVIGEDIFLLGGGTKNSKYYNTILKYDTITNVSTILSTTLPLEMAPAAGCQVDNKFYIFGGYSKNNFDTCYKITIDIEEEEQ